MGILIIMTHGRTVARKDWCHSITIDTAVFWSRLKRRDNKIKLQRCI